MAWTCASNVLYQSLSWSTKAVREPFSVVTGRLKTVSTPAEQTRAECWGACTLPHNFRWCANSLVAIHPSVWYHLSTLQTRDHLQKRRYTCCFSKLGDALCKDNLKSIFQIRSIPLVFIPWKAHCTELLCQTLSREASSACWEKKYTKMLLIKGCI